MVSTLNEVINTYKIPHVLIFLSTSAVYKDGARWHFWPNIYFRLANFFPTYIQPRVAVCADHNCFEFRGYLAGLCTGAIFNIIARKIFPKYLNHFFSTKKKLIWKSHLENKLAQNSRWEAAPRGDCWQIMVISKSHFRTFWMKNFKIFKSLKTIVANFKEKASLLDYMLRQYPLFFQVKNNRLQSFWTAQQCLLLAFIKHFPVSFKFKDLDG